MKTTATLSANSHVAKAWVARGARAGNLHGAIFHQTGTTFTSSEIPPGSLDRLMADPHVTVAMMGKTPKAPPAPDPSPDPALVEDDSDSADETADAAARLDALLAADTSTRRARKAAR